MRAPLGLSLALLAAACGSRAPAPSRPLHARLGGGTAALVAGVPLPASLVGQVAGAEQIDPPTALDRLIADALAAAGAKAAGADRAPSTRWALETIVARAAASRVRLDAHRTPPDGRGGRGPHRRALARVRSPGAGEGLSTPISSFGRKTPHSSTARVRSRRSSPPWEATATSVEDFEARAKALTSWPSRTEVRGTPSFVADGRIAEGEPGPLAPSFVKGAFALQKAGRFTSGVVESPFGWHVIRLVERRPAENRPRRPAAHHRRRRDLRAPRPRSAARAPRLPRRCRAYRAPPGRGDPHGPSLLERRPVKSPKTRSRPRAGATAGPARDTEASPFSGILSDLVARVPGAFGAVMVDGDGEAVDYTGRVEPYDLKLAGAHWQIVLREFRALGTTLPIGTPRGLMVRGARKSFIAHALPGRLRRRPAPWSPRRLDRRHPSLRRLRAGARDRSRMANPRALGCLVRARGRLRPNRSGRPTPASATVPRKARSKFFGKDLRGCPREKTVGASGSNGSSRSRWSGNRGALVRRRKPRNLPHGPGPPRSPRAWIGFHAPLSAFTRDFPQTSEPSHFVR